MPTETAAPCLVNFLNLKTDILNNVTSEIRYPLFLGGFEFLWLFAIVVCCVLFLKLNMWEVFVVQVRPRGVPAQLVMVSQTFPSRMLEAMPLSLVAEELRVSRQP